MLDVWDIMTAANLTTVQSKKQENGFSTGRKSTRTRDGSEMLGLRSTQHHSLPREVSLVEHNKVIRIYELTLYHSSPGALFTKGVIVSLEATIQIPLDLWRKLEACRAYLFADLDRYAQGPCNARPSLH